MTTKIDQKAYLQRYLNGPSDKKKKKKKVVKGKGFKIIDDDIDLSKLQELQGDELDILDQGEDAPQIAGIIDERPEEVKKAELFQSSSKWRVVTQDDGFNTKLQVEEIKKDIKEVEKENEIIFGKMYSDSEEEKKSDSDVSPPRKNNKRGITTKKQSASDSDFSPPRRKETSGNTQLKNNDYTSMKDSNSNKTKNKRNDYGTVLSPPRKQSKKYQNSDSDVSPPRKHNLEAQNVSRKRHKERKSRWDSPDELDRIQSKPHYSKTRQNCSDSDISPPRQSQKPNPRKKSNSSSDSSPPRQRKKDNMSKERGLSTKDSNLKNRSDCSDSDRQNRNSNSSKRKPERNHRTNKHSASDSDLSPPRQRDVKRRKDLNVDSDQSPPRRKDQRNKDSPPPSNKKMAKTLEGKMAGLQDAKQLKQENEAFRRREDEAYSRLTDDVSGRNAKAVSRKAKRETSEERQKLKEKAERQKELDEKYKKWSRGLKQIEAQEERVQEYIHEASKPLARYKSDHDLESNLRGVERDGDPMLNYIRERKRERGELAPAKPTYKGNFPPNRFNIRPGYRWDGVDRSNGYEKKFFEQQSKRKALEEDAYKWSTEDL
ncbi:unnamed protein product [Leptosia nina]|uniref:BUD13 homolog n=1 Tax=Leptosia nina TaxID=320188 RepID=A0AAV1JKS7_9NEOP